MDSSSGFLGTLRRLGQRLKSSQLLMLVSSLFVLDLLIPDPIPFVDEIILGILAILVGRWQERRATPPESSKPPPKNITPETD
ncbi:MAG: DUF6116 family protein [Acidobacteriota bacterium]